MVRQDQGKLVALTDRKDWPPALLDVRGDLIFLRGVVGTWGRLMGDTLTFTNGIVWTRTGARPKSREA